MNQRSSTLKAVREVQNQLTKVKLNHHNLDRRRPHSAGSKGQCIDMGTIDVNNDESSDTSWVRLQWKLGCPQEHHLRRAQHVVRHHAEIDLESEVRDQERLHDWMAIYSLDEISFVKSESTRLFRLSSLSWKDARTPGGQGDVERSTSKFPGVQRIQRIIWNRWRTNWVRVDYFPRTRNIADSPRDLKIGSSSCPCSKTSIGSRREITMNAFRIIKGKRFRKNPSGHWSFLGPGEKE